MITVQRIAPDGTAHRIGIRMHELITDMQSEDGSDAGPDPHDLYDASLGACKALTLVWYARRHDIPLEGVHVDVSRDADDERRGTYRLSTRLSLTGPMTEEQRARLLVVADKCPVHKLMSEVITEIETVLAPTTDPGG